MKELRIILISIIGLLLTILSYKLKYGFSIVTSLLYVFLILGGGLLFIWAIISDTLKYRYENSIQNFLSIILCISFTVIILIISYSIQNNFDKPTLLRVFYDGDINGSRIDFKTDGTYILENYVIGSNEYTYGEYNLKGDLIVLDKSEIDNVIRTDQLKLELGYMNKLFVFQVDEYGKKIDNATAFIVEQDNRSIKLK